MGNQFYFEWEPALMEWLQAHMGDFGAKLASFCSMFGEELILVLVMGLCYWCFNKKLAVYIGTNFCMACVWNPMIKNIVVRRRPYFDCPEVKCLKKVDAGADMYDIVAQGYSFPSGHSSSAVSIYGSIGVFCKKRWTTIIAILIPLLVGVSRFCLGVHFPTDVLCGWALGIFSILFVSLLKRIIRKKWLLYLVLALTAVPGMFYCTTNDYFTSFGMMIGFFLGNLFEERFVNFKNTHNVLKILLRLVGGILIYFVLNTVLKLPFSAEFLTSGTALAYAVRTVRYAVILFVVIGVYPMLFDKFGKAKSEAAA